jgi:hypothetical protein
LEHVFNGYKYIEQALEKAQNLEFFAELTGIGELCSKSPAVSKPGVKKNYRSYRTTGDP